MIPKFRFGLAKMNFFSKIYKMYLDKQITLEEFEDIKSKYNQLVK